MCGRYASTTTDKELRSLFDVAESVGPEVPPSYNVAPTRQVRVVLERAPRREPRAGAERQLRTAKWGLVPAWSKDPKIGSRLINARSETITEKPSFRSAAAKRRCIIPADGYFEWMKDAEGKKIPYFLHGDDPVLAMAGLYELWPDPSKAEDDPDRWLWTTTVLTTQVIYPSNDHQPRLLVGDHCDTPVRYPPCGVARAVASVHVSWVRC